MSEMMVTFQNQLSGVMETVFKAAIFEITRLVEDSFLEEVSRNREQVETLKKRLQWSESRVRRRCVDCGSAAGSSEERQEDKEKSSQTSGEKNMQRLKQECMTESWENCDAKNQDSPSVPAESDRPSSPAVTAEMSTSDVREEEKMENMLKMEAAPTGTRVQDEWKLSSGAEGSSSSPHEKSYSEHELQQIQEEWSAGLNQTPEPEPQADMDHIQGLLYRTRYNMEDLGNYGNQELDMEEINGLTDSAQRELLGFNMMGGSNPTEPGTSEESRKRARGKRGNKSSQNVGVVGGMDCLLINEQGYLQSVSGLPHPADDGAGNSIFSKDASASNSYFAGDAFNQVVALNSRCAEMLGDRESRAHTCSQCMIHFPDQASLKAHMKSHGQPNSTPTPHVCNHCGKKFPQACNLKVHQRVHLREGLHLCNHCGKGFTVFGDLRRHRCTPTDDKPYICSLCGNKFRRLWNLKLHRRIHTQEKPHRCGMCDKSFTRADILKIHQRTHTGERPYSCRTCGLTFKRLDHLRSHQRKHDTNSL